jgi:hypothetical protein
MRKVGIQFVMAVFALATVHILGVAQQSLTLGSVKQKYLNQKVVVIGYVTGGLAPQPVLLDWNPARESDERYSENEDAWLPATYKGKTATVIAIQLDAPSKQGKVNALGQPIGPDDAGDPYFDVVVKFDDGQMAMATGYPNTISMDMRLMSAQNAIAREMAANLPKVVGKDLFACGWTRLYSTDATLDEHLGQSAISKQISDVPFLVPLKVLAAIYNEIANAVILEVKLPDRREALAIATGDELTDKRESFMERASGSLLVEIPKSLTAQEIVAIKKKHIFRGMSKNAVDLVTGFSKSENDWGRGGEQIIYSGGLTVYLNNQGRVVDWQLLDNK